MPVPEAGSPVARPPKRQWGLLRKRHIVGDTVGLLLTVMVTAAFTTDCQAGQTLLARLRHRHWRITRVCADGGYTGPLVCRTLSCGGYCAGH